MKIAYIVSRFPLASETFIVREMNAIDGHEGIDIDLYALFPAGRPFAHPDAQPWLDRVWRASPLEALGATAWWMLRRPHQLLRCAATLVRAYGRRWRLSARALVTLPLAAAQARRMRRLETDHVHAHFATYPAIAAWVCRRLTGVTYSITAHAHDIYVDRSMLATLVGEADFVVTISEFNRTLLTPYAARSHVGAAPSHGRAAPSQGPAVLQGPAVPSHSPTVPSHSPTVPSQGPAAHAYTPIHVVHCGVNPELYTFRPRAFPQSGPIHALCVASLEEYKGHRVLLEALAGDSGLGRVHLDMVGAGSLESSLRDQIVRLGLTERVRMLGARTEAEVIGLLDEADLFVLASIVARDGQMEGVPVALMEALAAGAPTVATRLSGVAELVQDGMTGVLAEPGDPADMARAIRLVIDDAQATRARTEAGRALIEREFDIRQSGATLRGLFTQAIAERHSNNVADSASAALRV